MRIKSFFLFVLIFQETTASSDGADYEYYDYYDSEFLNYHGIPIEDYAYMYEDIKPTTGNGDLYEKETEAITQRNGISTTDIEQTIQTDSALKSTTENEADYITGTGIRLNATTEETKSAKEQTWLNMECILLASGCTIGGVFLTVAFVFVRTKVLNNHRRSNGEVNNRRPDGYDVTTMKEQTKENAYYIVLDETKRELPNFSNPKSSTQDSYSTLTFINATNENEYLELKKELAENEYDCVNQNY